MSTNRYDNAGKRGVGLTVGNMASRAKAQGTVDQTGSQTLGAGSFNIASIVDAAVGRTNFNLTNPMNAIASTAFTGGANNFHVYWSARAVGQFGLASASSAHTDADTTGLSMLLHGDMAGE